MDKKLFKAFIRVVKSLNEEERQTYSSFGGGWGSFDTVEIIREPIIKAEDKAEVKKILLEKYPQFFQKDKIYERSTKDEAQFFYVIIYPLYEWEKKMIEEGEWICSGCGQVHENKYISRPKMNERLYGPTVMFCPNSDECTKLYKADKYQNVEFEDNEYYVNKDSINYIYKCTEKATGKCYIGKTKNAPFFRWWNHLTRNASPFGLYLRQSKLSNWTFEVLEELPADMPDKDVFKIESEYIIKFDSIENGFNSLISNRSAMDNE